MATVKMVADRRFAYAGIVLDAGDVFSASEHDAKVLTLTGHASRKTEDAEKRGYKRRDMRAEH